MLEKEKNYDLEFIRLQEKLRNEKDEKIRAELGQKILEILARSKEDV